MLQDNLTNALIQDFFNLVKLTKDKPIYGCALVTDSDFGSIYLTLNTKTKETEKLDICDFWDIENWEFSDDDLEEQSLSEVSEQLFNLLLERKESLKKEVLPVFIASLKSLKSEAKKAGIDSDQICFFVAITDDDDSKNIENITAKDINSGKILESFLARYDDLKLK